MSMKIKYDTTSPSCLVWLTGRNAGKAVGTLSNRGYWIAQIDGKKIAVHRVIWELLNGPIPEGKVIDHINQNRSDNRIENLILASISDNNCNAHRKEREYPRGGCTLLVTAGAVSSGRTVSTT